MRNVFEQLCNYMNKQTTVCNSSRNNRVQTAYEWVLNFYEFSRFPCRMYFRVGFSHTVRKNRFHINVYVMAKLRVTGC